MYRLNYCQPGALPPFRAFALTAREGLVALPRVSLPSVAGPGLQALPPAEVEGWPSAILNAAYGAYTMETICGTTHCDCLPDSNNSLYTILNYVLILLTHRFRLPDMQETGPSVRQRLEAPRWGSSLLVRFAGIRFQPDRLFGITKIDGFFHCWHSSCLYFFSFHIFRCIPCSMCTSAGVL